jgi:hypothetical protein
MQKQEFLQQLHGLSGNGNPEVAGVISRFPFFYAARVLEAIQLKSNDALNFEEAIRAASLFSPNRELLKRIVEGHPFVELKVEMAQSNPVVPFVEELFVVPIEINTEPAVLEQIATYPELLKDEQRSTEIPKAKEEIAEHRMTFSLWLKQIGGARTPETSNNESAAEERDREALIRKFIETEPQISKPQKASFYSAVEMARKSTEERDDIVSETLAGVYAQQGDVARATRIYQKLCLLYPEKSSYFATLIKNLTSTT